MKARAIAILVALIGGTLIFGNPVGASDAPSWCTDPNVELSEDSKEVCAQYIEPEYVEIERVAELFWGGFGVGVTLFTGHPQGADFCAPPSEPTVVANVLERRDGSSDLKVSPQEVPIVLYAVDIDAFVFLEQQCEAATNGEETAQPIAYGTGEVRERIRAAADGSVEIFNSLTGYVTDEEGTRWRVKTWADFAIDSEGGFSASPADFQGISIYEAPEE